MNGRENVLIHIFSFSGWTFLFGWMDRAWDVGFGALQSKVVCHVFRMNITSALLDAWLHQCDTDVIVFFLGDGILKNNVTSVVTTRPGSTFAVSVMAFPELSLCGFAAGWKLTGDEFERAQTEMFC